MAVISIENGVLVAVSGLIIKEGANLWIKYKTNKSGNGKNNLKGLLEDIRGQGKLTLDKVGGIEKEQGEIKIELKGVTTQMAAFNEKCVVIEKHVDQLDERVFDHIKKA